MTRRRTKFYVRQFNPKGDDFKNLLKLDQSMFKDERNRLNIAKAREWCEVNPKIFHILHDKHYDIHGYLGVVPIKTIFAKNILIEKKYREHFPLCLTGKDVLSEEEAKEVAQEEGNAIYATCHARNPKKGTLDHQFAILLYLVMVSIFHKHRMQIVIGRSCNEGGKAVWRDGGCKDLCDLQKTKDGIPTIYYFDMDMAMQRPSTGLGVVMTRIWGAKGYELHSLLNLNDDEKEVLRLELYGGYTRKEIADYLGINPHTVEGRWKAIAKKGKTIGLNDRWAIKGYAFQNYFEFI